MPDEVKQPPARPEPESRKPGLQRQQQKKTLLAGLIMAVPVLVFLYFLFSGPAPGDDAQNQINTSIPDGRSDGIMASKQQAVEKLGGDGSDRVATLGDRFSLTGGTAPPEVSSAEMARSQEAYREATRQMGAFTAPVRNDPELEELKRQVAELTLRQMPGGTPPVPDPMALAEQQFALASKYFGGGPNDQPTVATSGDKVVPVPVRRPAENVVSSLSADSSAGERHFHTPVGGGAAVPAGAIRAETDGEQTLKGGSRIRLRLLDDIAAGGTVVVAGTLLYGTVGIEGQRMTLKVSSIESGGVILPVEMDGYDTDGQPGLFVPNSTERTAMKDAAAGIGAGFGSSISFSRSAGQQVAMDVVRGALTGGTQYLATKLRETKVTVKAGYRLLLISKK